MFYETEEITADLTITGRVLHISDFTIREDLLMSFGDSLYLPAMEGFIYYIDSLEADKAIFHIGRDGYSLLFGRFGFEMQDGVMVRDLRTSARPTKDASIFDFLDVSAFGPERHILMKDGSRKLIGDLDVGDEVKDGGMVVAMMTGRMRKTCDIGSIKCCPGSVMLHDGQWIRISDHPDVRIEENPNGWEGLSIGTENHVLWVDDILFRDFYLSKSRKDEMMEFSEVALSAMNARQE